MSLDYDQDIPESAEVGEVGGLTEPTYAQGCTGGGIPPCNCITLGYQGDGGGLHVTQIAAGAKNKTGHGAKVGWWRVLRNGHLFVKSIIQTLPADSTLHQHHWCNRDTGGTCHGWTFADGDVFCVGFWVQSIGDWFEGFGSVCETVHA